MTNRISPIWWPFLAWSAPVLAPLAGWRYARFRNERSTAARINDKRIAAAPALELPALESVELTVLVDATADPGFASDSAVSYVLRTDAGSVLFDLGYGPTTRALAANAVALDLTMADFDALVVSHLHPDHVGGLKAARSRKVAAPPELGPPIDMPCYLPDAADAPGFQSTIVGRPQIIAAGIATTGPLARSLFFLGWTEEQALVMHLKGKGLLVVTGCGHPTVETILRMVRVISDEPVYAVAGGLHFPITASRDRRAGIETQTIFGTGKPPWERITGEDLAETINVLNRREVRRVLLSPHDTCDHAIDLFKDGLDAQVDVLRAGATYRI